MSVTRNTLLTAWRSEEKKLVNGGRVYSHKHRTSQFHRWSLEWGPSSCEGGVPCRVLQFNRFPFFVRQKRRATGAPSSGAPVRAKGGCRAGSFSSTDFRFLSGKNGARRAPHLLDRQISGASALEYLIDIGRRLPIKSRVAYAV